MLVGTALLPDGCLVIVYRVAHCGTALWQQSNSHELFEVRVFLFDSTYFYKVSPSVHSSSVRPVP